jgi:hypothetical protein
MKRNKSLWMSILLMLTLPLISMKCQDLEEEEERISYDETYEVYFYNHDPWLNSTLGHWNGDEFIEFTPQSEPPYTLLVHWWDDKGKQAIDYVLEKNSDTMTKLAEIPQNNEYRISSKLYFGSPNFYVSSAYKSSEKGWGGGYDILILPQIIVKMKEGKSIEAIEKDFAHFMTLSHEDQYMKNIYIFDGNFLCSYGVLSIASRVHQRDDVEWAEANMYGGFTTGCLPQEMNN